MRRITIGFRQQTEGKSRGEGWCWVGVELLYLPYTPPFFTFLTIYALLLLLLILIFLKGVGYVGLRRKRNSKRVCIVKVITHIV